LIISIFRYIFILLLILKLMISNFL